MSGESNLKFKKLSPKDDIDISGYKEALGFALKDAGISNIALSGSYGSGKSSTIETYKKESNKNFLHISLAHFQYDTQEEKLENQSSQVNLNELGSKNNIVVNSDTKKLTSDMILEGKILNQLLHQINPRNIPQSIFRLKTKKSKSKSIFWSLFIVIMILLLVYNVKNDSWIKYASKLITSSTFPEYLKSFLKLSSKQEMVIYSWYIFIMMCAFLFYKIIKNQIDKTIIKRLSLKGNEIELFGETEESYFDKYLNDVIYLFKYSQADVIVFEDLDRFENVYIFEKLKEINTLINGSYVDTKRTKLVGNIFRKVSLINKPPKKIKFLYLLRDDIFQSKDRTKFFDIIIPVVPVIDASNSYDKFLEIFKEGKIDNLFDERFLQKLSLYIDDMRLLINIYNEFVIYRKQLMRKLDDIDAKALVNPNKLLALIAYKNIFPKDFSDLQKSKGFVYTIFLKREDYLKNRINNKLEELKSLEKELNGNQIDEERDTISQKIEILQKAIDEYPLKKIKDIILVNDIKSVEEINILDECNDFKYIKRSDYFDMLVFLIRNGYIDETYSDYMTYFYENSLKRTDKIYLRSIADERSLAFDYQLSNPELILQRLDDVDFRKEEILNFDLLDYLLDSKGKYSNQISLFVGTLKQLNSTKFIVSFYNRIEKDIENDFVNLLLIEWPNAIEIMIDTVEVPFETIDSILANALSNFKGFPITQPNIDNTTVVDYLVNSRNVLRQVKGTGKFFLNLISSKIKFKVVDFTEINSEVARSIYIRNSYTLNLENISGIFLKFYNNNHLANHKHSNYTLINELKAEELQKYVENNINSYMEHYLEFSEGEILDKVSYACDLLNNDELSIENKQDYIVNLKTILADLENVKNKELWEQLVLKKRIKPSEENILAYYVYKDNNWSKELVNLVNDFNVNLRFDPAKIKKAYDDIDFFRKTTACMELSNKKYTEILISTHLAYGNGFGITGVSSEKMKILIDHKIIKMTIQCLQSIRKSYPNSLIRFINTNLNEYLEIIQGDQLLYNYDELIETLNSQANSKLEIQRKIMNSINGSISVRHKSYSANLIKEILKTKFDIADLDYLLKYYGNFSQINKEEIYRLSVQYYKEIVEKELKINSKELLNKLLRNQEIELKDRQLIFSENLKQYTKVEIQDLLQSLRFSSEFLRLFTGRNRPKFIVNKVNRTLLEYFYANGWIISLKEKDEQFRTIGKK